MVIYRALSLLCSGFFAMGQHMIGPIRNSKPERLRGGELMTVTPVYGRIRFTIPLQADRAEFLLPGGGSQAAIPYLHHDADFTYDLHGYETVTLKGKGEKQVAFTACAPGRHVLRAYAGDALAAEIPFDAENTGLPGFVGVSERDRRYFALSGGESYVPIGLNLVGCDYDRLPAGEEHFTASAETATTGLIQWRRWFRRMKESGVNYCRIWLSNRYTQARTELMGVHDPVAFARFEALMEIARASGVRVKLCLEHWRCFHTEGHFAYRRYVDPDTGVQLMSEENWLSSPVWNARWLKDIEPYIARYQNDPVVFAWELWNEINCIHASRDAIAGFTQRMLGEVKAMSPLNMAVNSLGSFDDDGFQVWMDRFRDMPEIEFQQIHRYLDQGAPMEICRTDPVAFTIESIGRSRRPDKPVIFTETGAVNDRHVGPFRFYACDDDGLIFHDTTYPALFAGTAGSGHIWHWNQYVEPKNLWRHFRPLADVVEGIQMDEEEFVPEVAGTTRAWILMLRGKRHTLALVRSKEDRWDHVLRDAKTPMPIESFAVPIDAASADVFWLMDEQPGDVTVLPGSIRLPAFVHGCVLRITNA